MKPVDAPTSIPDPPTELGRLGSGLGWLARAQGGWPPSSPRQRRDVGIVDGAGFAAACDEADALADSGADLLTLEGPAATAPALVLLCALLDIEPVLAVGTSTGAGWAQLLVAVRDGLPGARALVGDPEQLVTDPVLGRVTGLLAQSAVRRTPVVLGSSPVLAAAALAAERIAPGARRWWLAGSAPTTTAVGLVYAELALDPLLDLGLSMPGAATLAADLLISGIGLLRN